MAMSPAKPKPSATRILFLADCGPDVGGGHVMRCLALAGALIGKGAACAMLATPASAKVLDAFAPDGLERIEAEGGSTHAFVLAARAAAERWGPDVMFVDHYRLAANDERQFEEAGAIVAVIDDLADRPHGCRLLVDPTLGRTPEAYAALTPKGCRVLTGPDHALLAPVFAEARPTAAIRRHPAEPPRRLLISLGLMDLGGVTGRALGSILPQLGDMTVDVIVGSSAPSLPELRRLVEADARIRLHVDARDMAGLIFAADIGIGAGGVSTWERAVLGLPSISLVLADNQRGLALELDRRGALLALETSELSADLPAAFAKLIGDGPLRRSLSETSAALCDGQGAARVAEALLALAD